MNILFYILVCIPCCFSYQLINKFIQKDQWKRLQFFITHPKITFEMRNKINRILYVYYDDWAFFKAIKFKKMHKYKCRHITLDELYTYSNIGLITAIQKYNGKSNFAKYAEIYVNGQLYKAITDLHPLTSISKNQRIHKITHKTSLSLHKFKKKLQTKFIGKDEWLLEKLKIQNTFYDNNNNNIDFYDYQEIWNKINELKPFERQIFYSKLDFFFNKKASNKTISEKMGYSEEYIRQIIVKSMKKICDVK